MWRFRVIRKGNPDINNRAEEENEENIIYDS